MEKTPAKDPIDRTQARSSLWRAPDFLKLWAGQTVSVFGSQFTQLALPLIAVNMLRASAAEMGFLRAIQFAPFLLFGLVTGVWVDRLPRRPVLILSDVGRGVFLAAIPVAAVLGILGMGTLYGIGFVVGVLTVFFDVAYQAYLPVLVNQTQLVEGNTKLEVSRSLAQVAGPGIAGLLIQAISAPLTILLDALSFGVSALSLGLIRRPEGRPERIARTSMLGEIGEGLAVIFGNRLLRAIAGTTGTFNFFSSALFALYILYATRGLDLTAVSLGAIFAIGNTGAVAGALLAAPLARRLGIGPAIVMSAGLSGLSMLPVPLATPASAFPLLVVSSVLVNLSTPLYNINQVSLRQAITPLRLQGRMNATMRFVVWGTMPLGSLAGGILGQTIGLRPAVGISAVGALFGVLWVLFSPLRTLVRIPDSTANR